MERLTLSEIENNSKYYIHLSEEPRNSILREYKGDFTIRESAGMSKEQGAKILQAQLINILLVENCTKGRLYKKPDIEIVNIFYETLNSALKNRDITYLYKNLEKDFALRFDRPYEEIFVKLLCDRVYKNEYTKRMNEKENSR